MINDKKILQLHFDNESQRTINSTASHSRYTNSDVIQRAKRLSKITDGMDNLALFELLYLKG